MSENCDINACDCRPSWWQGMIKGFDSLSYPTGVVDRSGKWIILNKAALAFFGVDSVAALSAAASSALWGSRLRPPPGEGEADPEAPESVYLLDSRTEKVYQRQSSPLYDDAGELVGKVESIHDVTNLYEADERVRVMIDAAPLCCNFWNDKFENIDCNLEAAKLFELPDKKTYLRRFYELSPEKQPNGRKSADEALRHITTAFKDGFDRFEWMHQKLNGEQIPAEITLVKVKHRKEDIVLGYTRDLRSARLVSEVDDLDWLTHVFRSLPFPTGVASAAGKWIFLNRAALDFFGVKDAEELAGVTSSGWGGRLKPLPAASALGAGGAEDEVYYHDEKTGMIYQRYSSPLHDNFGGLVGRVECIQDITNLFEADERVRAMVDAAPLCCNFWNDKLENIDCNLEAAKLFDLPDRKAYLDRFFELSPERQPNGNKSSDEAFKHITTAFKEGFDRFKWMHQKLNGEQIPAEITLVRVKQRKGNIVLGYTRDLRQRDCGAFD